MSTLHAESTINLAPQRWNFAFMGRSSVPVINILEKIKTIRERMSMTQAEVAEELNMDVSGYAKLERGVSELRWSTFQEICKIFKMTETELINFDPVTNSS